jgi:hypothetical protein
MHCSKGRLFSYDLAQLPLFYIEAMPPHALQADSGEAERLSELAGVLHVVRERARASPAVRLLDDVLDMLGDDITDGQVGGRLGAFEFWFSRFFWCFFRCLFC